MHNRVFLYVYSTPPLTIRPQLILLSRHSWEQLLQQSPHPSMQPLHPALRSSSVLSLQDTSQYNHLELEIHAIVEKPLSHPALRQYLRERGISADVASRFCCQVEYRYNGKQFFAVGFKNNSGGYEIRNRFFKGCVSPKDITLIGRNSNVCHLYEGFMDFLSAVILGIGRGEDHIVLNSVANMQKVHHLLDGYAQVYCHLDNDEAGENACVELQKRYGDKVIDHSHLYTGYKDLNEYLMSHKTRK